MAFILSRPQCVKTFIFTDHVSCMVVACNVLRQEACKQESWVLSREYLTAYSSFLDGTTRPISYDFWYTQLSKGVIKVYVNHQLRIYVNVMDS